MKQQVEKCHFYHHFDEVDRMFLCLQAYNKISLKEKSHQKFAPKFNGLPLIFKHIRQVAYKLSLTFHYKIHHVFCPQGVGKSVTECVVKALRDVKVTGSKPVGTKNPAMLRFGVAQAG